MINYPKIFGTCQGANKAIEMAYHIKNEFKDKNVFIYKEILHNKYVTSSLEKEGIKTIDNLDLVNKDDIVILRAHGEGKSTYDYLNERKITYYDATCINVLKVHNLVIDKYNKGYKIIIIGKKEHPEVIGTNGWCNNEAIIIETKDDYKNINKNDKYYIVCQTTISIDKLNDLLKYMNKNKYNYEYDNTICNYQKLIQESSSTLAKEMDLMIIIGGKNSSNSKLLYDECNKYCKSLFFENINEVFEFFKKNKINNKFSIGITGGASTPKEQIFEIAHLLEFITYYQETKSKIEKELKKFNKSLINNNDNPIIKDAINKLIDMNFDGKCIRGTLIDLGYKLHKNDDYSLKLATSYETFETSILIQDDIIDNANLRRGKNTIHYNYKNELNDEEISKNLALCIGDLGLYLTNDLIIKHYKNDKNFSKLFNYYNNIVINTIKGEIIDVYLPYIEKHDKKHILHEEDIMEIYKLKTSHYTIVGPFVLGMILSNSSNKEIELFKNALEPIGIAFQIKDDILGIFNTNTIGKTASDIEEFKQTILYSYIKINKKEYLEKLLNYYGKEDSLDQVKDIMIKSGSLEYATNKMEELFFISKHNISNLKIKQEVKNILLGLITYLELRQK